MGETLGEGGGFGRPGPTDTTDISLAMGGGDRFQPF